jgi:N-acetylglucosaminyldiphosphoundecaprenol N-acetyl-beta-D-mannosaminyltransferase
MWVHEQIGSLEATAELTVFQPEEQLQVASQPERALEAEPPTAILGIPFDHLTLHEAVRRVEEMIASKQPHYLVTANVDFLVQARQDVELRHILTEAELVLCDGTPLVWVSRLLGHPLPERVAGADVAPLLIEAAARKGYRIFFLGGKPEVTAQAVEKLQRQYPSLNIAGYYSPPFHSLLEMDHEEILRWIRPAKPDVLFVSFGCPKAEKWMAMHYRSLGVPVTIGVGATIDFLAGKKKRAPRWMQRSGTEWIFRLFQEPRRLFRRYMTDVWHFGRAIFEQWWWLSGDSVAALPSSRAMLVEGPFGKRLIVPERFDVCTLRRDASIWEQIEGNHCVLDLACVTFIDSAAMGLLIRLQKRLKNAGFRLVLLAPSKAVRRALRLMRQTNLFLIASDAAEAREMIHIAEQEEPVVPPCLAAGPLRWKGDITAHNADQVWECTEADIISRSLRQERLNIDLSSVRFLDSTAVALMARAKREVLQFGASLQFTNPPDDVRNVVRQAGLENFLFGRNA